MDKEGSAGFRKTDISVSIDYADVGVELKKGKRYFYNLKNHLCVL